MIGGQIIFRLNLISFLLDNNDDDDDRYNAAAAAETKIRPTLNVFVTKKKKKDLPNYTVV